MRATVLTCASISLALLTSGMPGLSVDPAVAVTTTQLMSDGGYDGQWSRDGRNRIVYTDGYHIFMIPSSGGTRTEITYEYSGSWGQWPSWSPEGNWVAFWDVFAGLLVCPAVEAGDTSASTVHVGSPGFFAEGARLSPGGDQIAFCRTNSGADGIYVCPASEGGAALARRLTVGGGGPSWSPDGRYIAYSGQYDYGFQRGIFVVPVDGSAPPALIPVNQPYAGELWSPDWSPNGGWIACTLVYTASGWTRSALWALPVGRRCGRDLPAECPQRSRPRLQVPLLVAGRDPDGVRKLGWGALDCVGPADADAAERA